MLDKLVPDWLIGATGSILILFSGFCFLAAVWREMSTSPAPPHPDAQRLPAWLLIAINGFLMMVALAALVGIWAA